MNDLGDGGVDLAMDRPHSARMYDYYLGGITNFPADRETAVKTLNAFPAAPVAARINRRFMHRATRYAAERGVHQFLDIGTGIPTSPNLHEIAQGVVPRARVVYTDNDPIVLAHARALLRSHPDGVTAYLQADARDPHQILTHHILTTTLDFTRPIALSLVALLHFLTDDEAHALVDRLKAALPVGSTLAISHGTPDFDPEGLARVARIYAEAGSPIRLRTHGEIAAFFAGWDLVEPGVVATRAWRPDPDDPAHTVTDAEASTYAALARKP
ncbi:SAM-dependent methyltransferase [Streptomyces sp. NPDC049906]|uniref:SAM-dependent methyltransferase n=1 Tax=Streptomyces sp. NPDC049906 TaxID=3155656 RepID=UPI00342A861B